jgi:hypothetical protein
MDIKMSELIEDSDEEKCSKPCDPDGDCEVCAPYWERMKLEGFWDAQNHQWTSKGWREIVKS